MTVEIICGDCLTVMASMPAGYFHTCVTSPPYFRQRKFLQDSDPAAALELGREDTVAAYVDNLVKVARGVRRVLRDDGTLWLNVADCYGSSGKGGGGGSLTEARGPGRMPGARTKGKSKSLLMVPERLLIALADDGWVVRSKIRWFKVSPLPDPVRDRPTSAVEEIFLLAKHGGHYFYDQEAERVKSAEATVRDGRVGSERGVADEASGTLAYGEGTSASRKSVRNAVGSTSGRNLWNWWEVEGEGSASWFMANEPLRGEHYATFPSALPTRCIRLATSEHGCCPACGEPYRRVVERRKVTRERPNDRVKRTGAAGTGNVCGNTVAGVVVETVGWEVACGCEAGDPVPCRVLDPFCGAATTPLAAARLGRSAVGIELSGEYCEMGRRRLALDSPLFNR